MESTEPGGLQAQHPLFSMQKTEIWASALRTSWQGVPGILGEEMSFLFICNTKLIFFFLEASLTMTAIPFLLNVGIGVRDTNHMHAHTL